MPCIDTHKNNLSNTHVVTVIPSHSVFRVAGVRPVGTAREAVLPVMVAVWTAAR